MIDRDTQSAIAHATLKYANPLSEEELLALLARCELKPGDAVIDFGCGKGEVLAQLVERYGVRGVGVERSAPALAQARVRLPQGVEWRQQGIEEARVEEERYRLALAIGVGAPFPGFTGVDGTLRALARFVVPGGLVALGETYWKQPPPAEYLALLGCSESDMRTHDGNLAAGTDAGLTLVALAETSEDAWDAYEGAYAENVEAYARAHGGDPDAQVMADGIRRWRDGYLRWGRATLGFALYLFRTPAR